MNFGIDPYHTFESLFQPGDLPARVRARVVGVVIKVRVEEYGDKPVLQDVRVKAAARGELAPSRRVLDQIFPAALFEEVRVECVV